MARTRKSIQPLNLHTYDVLIEDRGVRSDYFKISQFDGYFYGGRNAFLLAGANVLKPNSKILVEILNKNNETVYSAPVSSFIEGNSRLIQVEIYSDTPIGPGKIIILGSTDVFVDGSPIPTEWNGKYNVRWITDVVISPLVENKTPIRFINPPTVQVTEKIYDTVTNATYSESINLPVDLKFRPKNYNIFPNGYLVNIVGPTNARFFSDYLGGKITGSILINSGSIQETASINLPITRIYNSKMAETEGVLVYSNTKTLFLEGVISGSGSIYSSPNTFNSYTTTLNPYGSVEVTSSVNILYNKLFTETTGTPVSYANLRIVDLKTLSGEIHKIRISYKPETDPGGYVLLADVPTGVRELYAVDSGSNVVETGKFTKININDYWYSATMSLQKNEVNPSLPPVYFTSSLATSQITQCCTELLDSINATPTIVNNKFINNVSYFIGSNESNTIQLFPRTEYTVSFDAYVSKASASIDLIQDDYSLEVYAVPSSGSSTNLLTDDPRGQLLGILSPNKTFQRQNFETVEFNFTPRISEAGQYGLRFIIYGGSWGISNVSVKPAQESFFSPDEVDILVPIISYEQSLLTFKLEYLDINNNSSDVVTVSTPVYFTGRGGGGGVSGGSANYIPLWASSTSLTSSVIYQSNGNIGIGTTTPDTRLSVNGSGNYTGSLGVTGAFTAQTKSFKILHQTHPGKHLVYGVLEGAEHAVYARGKLENSDTIILPDEWTWLVDENSITVQLTPIGSCQKLHVESIQNNIIKIANENLFTTSIKCYYLVHAVRKDVSPLQIIV